MKKDETKDEDFKSTKKFPTWAIVGIVVSVVLGLAFLWMSFWPMYQERQQAKRSLRGHSAVRRLESAIAGAEATWVTR